MDNIEILNVGDIVILDKATCGDMNHFQQPRSKQVRQIGIVTGYKYKDTHDVVLVAWINGLKILDSLHFGYLKKIAHVDFDKWTVSHITLNIPVERD